MDELKISAFENCGHNLDYENYM